jgi:hypothetical protein
MAIHGVLSMGVFGPHFYGGQLEYFAEALILLRNRSGLAYCAPKSLVARRRNWRRKELAGYIIVIGAAVVVAG